MGDLLKLIWYAVAGLFRSRAALQAEVLAVRHQLNVLRRRAPKRVAVSNIDRLVFAGLYHLAPEVLDAVKILKPETIIRWHRAGFRAWWRWKSRPRGGRPRTPDEIRQFIREMSVANPLWGAPRIHGELIKLSSAWMSAGPPWRSTWRKDDGRHRRAGGPLFTITPGAIASIDMFVVPTISFELLYGVLILRQSRRELLWLGVTAPSQCGMACPPDDRGLGLGRASTLLGPRPRRRVWRCLHPAHPGHGIRDRPVSGAVALAERICGEADRLDPTGGDTDQRSHGATADRGG